MSEETPPPTPSSSPKRSLPRAAGRYVVTLPERVARASAALAGGALYETSQVTLPLAVRDAKLDRVALCRWLRNLIEWVGGGRGIYEDEEMPADLSGAGGIMLMGTGLGLLAIKALPVANYLPALVLAPLFVWLGRRFKTERSPSG